MLILELHPIESGGGKTPPPDHRTRPELCLLKITRWKFFDKSKRSVTWTKQNLQGCIKKVMNALNLVEGLVQRGFSTAKPKPLMPITTTNTQNGENEGNKRNIS